MNQVLQALPMTSGTMLTAALLACVEPARRALRIYPTDASRHL
jgi:ABC-type lipoprotein release transport system permease subunit